MGNHPQTPHIQLTSHAFNPDYPSLILLISLLQCYLDTYTSLCTTKTITNTIYHYTWITRHISYDTTLIQAPPSQDIAPAMYTEQTAHLPGPIYFRTNIPYLLSPHTPYPSYHFQPLLAINVPFACKPWLHPHQSLFSMQSAILFLIYIRCIINFTSSPALMISN